MLKLFIITLSLFSTIPTFAMRAIKPRLMQRGYATMTKENFTQLMKHQDSPEQFAYDLDKMKKDSEDLDKLWTILYSNVKNLEKELKSHDSSKDKLAKDINLFSFFTMASGLGYVAVNTYYPIPPLPILEVWMNDTLAASLATVYAVSLSSGGLLFLLSKNKWLAKGLQRFNNMNNELETNKKNLAKVQSLLLQELKHKE